MSGKLLGYLQSHFNKLFSCSLATIWLDSGLRVHAVFDRKPFLDEDKMKTVKANSREVLYHNRKFDKNCWYSCFPFEISVNFGMLIQLLILILLKIPSKYFPSNDVDIISEDVENFLIDT